MQSKKLKKLDNIIYNMSEKECEFFKKMLQRDELLGGWKVNVYEVSFNFY